MIIGLIGLGRMGQSIAARLLLAGISVIGYDSSSELSLNLPQSKNATFELADNLKSMTSQARVIWLMVPAGQIVDNVINELTPYLRSGDIIIDGGNSFFKDSIRRYETLKKQGIHFIDCGTSGGLHGGDIGFSLMIGGDAEPVESCQKLFKAIAAPEGYAHVGPAGAGHYVKMVHNGIEYALLQAYAEGFQVLKEGSYKDLDLEQISNVWNHGSIIRSWILELAHAIFTKDQNFDDIYGKIDENKTGYWTSEEAKHYNIPVRVIDQSLDIRAKSRVDGGNYATKLVALLRNAFGGHHVTHKGDMENEKK